MNDKLTVRERLNRELNIIAWVFECQFMEASKNVIDTPGLHSKGRYLAGSYMVTSNIKIMKLQTVIDHYTKRYEKANNSILILNELSRFYDRAKYLRDFCIQNLSENSEIVVEFKKNIPLDFDEKMKYFKYHSAIIVTEDIEPQHIIFDLDFQSNEAKWTRKKFNYHTDHKELFLYCRKLIEFIDDLRGSNNGEKDAVLTLENKLIPSQKDLYIPYKYFSHLTTEKNNKGEYFLSRNELLLFLKRAFNQDSSIPRQKLNTGSREISKITRFFYEFIDYSIEYETSRQEGEKYIRILSDNFIGYPYKKVKDNWSLQPQKLINNK